MKKTSFTPHTEQYTGSQSGIQTKFAEHVRAIVRQIPKGETRTYGQVAMAAGRPGAARAVGTIMRNNYDPTVPCHRVVRADGRIGEYNRGGSTQKRALLVAEGALAA